MTDSWLRADWPAPAHVHAGCTTRLGGNSRAPYDSFNLAQHVGDDPHAVNRNRQQLKDMLALTHEPVWLQQVHGRRVMPAHAADPGPADAGWTDTSGVTCAVLTADCLPLLLCNRTGSRVAAVHVGWRGLVAGIIAAAVAVFDRPGDLLAWLGPAIGPAAFEVGPDVFDACRSAITGAEDCFRPGQPGHWQADLPALARLALGEAGVNHCYSSGLCTYSDVRRFYSYRRDGTTGRMAGLIWIDPQTANRTCL